MFRVHFVLICQMQSFPGSGHGIRIQLLTNERNNNLTQKQLVLRGMCPCSNEPNEDNWNSSLLGFDQHKQTSFQEQQQMHSKCGIYEPASHIVCLAPHMYTSSTLRHAPCVKHFASSTFYQPFSIKHLAPSTIHQTLCPLPQAFCIQHPASSTLRQAFCVKHFPLSVPLRQALCVKHFASSVPSMKHSASSILCHAPCVKCSPDLAWSCFEHFARFP